MSICLQKIKIDGHSVQLFQDEEGGRITGYHFPLDKYYPDPLGEGQLPEDFEPVRMTKTKEEIEEEMQSIQEYQTLDVEERGLRAETLERFSIKTGVSEADGVTVKTLHFPYTKNGQLVGYETKLLDPKKFWRVGDTKDVDLFGWEQAIAADSPKLIIVEGPLDVPSAYQMLKDKNVGTKWDYIEPAVVSIPNGAGNAKASIVKNINKININFKEVVLAFDTDEAGKRAAEEVVKVLPEIKVANLPLKDANACLTGGREKGFCSSLLFRASKPRNTRTVSIEDLFEKAKTPAVLGMSWPWSVITELTRGIRFGETIYITGTAKIGKSDVLNTIVSHLVKEHGIKCFVCKPEEANVKSVKMIAGKLVGKIFHDPNVPFDTEAYDEATELMKGKIQLVNIYQNLDWDILKGDIIAAANDGCKAVFIDPLTVLTTGLSAADANTKLQEIAQNLSTLALDLDIVIFIFTHLKNPKHGEPYDRGGKINVGDITGSRGMTRSCNMILGIQGNNDPELEDDSRNLRDIVLLSDREFGASGIQHLFWDKHTSLFNEVRK